MQKYLLNVCGDYYVWDAARIEKEFPCKLKRLGHGNYLDCVLEEVEIIRINKHSQNKIEKLLIKSDRALNEILNYIDYEREMHKRAVKKGGM